MQFDKNSLRNPNIYTAFALIFVFMWFSGLLPSNPIPMNVNSNILKLLITLISLLGAGSSVVFIITRTFKD